MSQIDRLNFVPHLFWFIILFLVFYFLIFSYLLPVLFQSMETRSLFFESLLKDSLAFNIFYYFFIVLNNTSVIKSLIIFVLNYLKQAKNINILMNSLNNKTYFII